MQFESVLKKGLGDDGDDHDDVDLFDQEEGFSHNDAVGGGDADFVHGGEQTDCDEKGMRADWNDRIKTL